MITQINMGSQQISKVILSDSQMKALDDKFGKSLMKQVSISRYTTSRIGGLSDHLIEAKSAKHLTDIVTFLWELNIPFVILGGGSNVLISDDGVRGVVVINRIKQGKGMKFDRTRKAPTVWAESGVNFSLLAHRVAELGFSGFEWAEGIPGTLGGAIVGNAGAHGRDISSNLIMADILHREPDSKSLIVQWKVDQLEYSYRDSRLKKTGQNAVVLSALLKLERSTVEQVRKVMEQYAVNRRRTQPLGASMGSMFKNPIGDYAGRLIEAAGLKGTRIGHAEISPMHANFFINHGNATARDVFNLIKLARDTVSDRFGITLELEIALVGKF